MRFKSPRPVMAQKFCAALLHLLNVAVKPGALKTAVETLGFQHLDVDAWRGEVCWCFIRPLFHSFMFYDIYARVRNKGSNTCSTTEAGGRLTVQVSVARGRLNHELRGSGATRFMFGCACKEVCALRTMASIILAMASNLNAEM